MSALHSSTTTALLPRVYRRIRLFGMIHLAMLVAFSGIIWATVPDSNVRTMVTLAMAGASPFPLLLILLPPGRAIYILAIVSIVFGVVSSSLVDPLTGSVSGVPWILQLVWPPITLLIFRNLRVFLTVSILNLVLLAIIPLLELTGKIPTQFVSAPVHMQMLWLTVLVIQVVLMIVIGLSGYDEQRALEESHQSFETLQTTNEALTTAYAEIQAAHAQVSESADRQQRLRDQVNQLSAPLIDLGYGLVLVPLMGEVDPLRIRHLTTSVLGHIHSARSTRVLLDMTGMELNDAQVIRELDPMIRAIRLLGCEVSVTGVSAELAHMLVLETNETMARHAMPLSEALKRHIVAHQF